MQIEPDIETRPTQPYLGIRRQVTDGVPAVVDVAFPALIGWLGENGIEPSGPPFIRVREIGEQGEPLELDVAVPAAAHAMGEEDVIADALPAGRYATAVHVGPYRSETHTDLADARTELLAWVAEQDQTVLEGTDHLLVSPPSEPDFTKWTTELTFLIAEEAS